jgi:hypothetical protein
MWYDEPRHVGTSLPITHFGCSLKPSILRACVREEDAGGEGGGRAFYYTYMYSGKR